MIKNYMRYSLLPVFFFVTSLSAYSEETKSKSPDDSKLTPNQIQLQSGTEKEDFCANIADDATEARHILQMRQLQTLQGEIDKKIALLEEKQKSYAEMRKNIENQGRLAETRIAEIYGKMKPDVAAAQLSIIDTVIATEIIRQLNARIASTILNEMKPEKAAVITAHLAETYRTDEPSQAKK